MIAKKSVISIRTTSDVSLDVQVSEVSVTDSNGTHEAGKEILLTLTDNSGIIKKSMSATMSASDAGTLAFVLRRLSKELKQKKA